MERTLESMNSGGVGEEEGLKSKGKEKSGDVEKRGRMSEKSGGYRRV